MGGSAGTILARPEPDSRRRPWGQTGKPTSAAGFVERKPTGFVRPIQPRREDHSAQQGPSGGTSLLTWGCSAERPHTQPPTAIIAAASTRTRKTPQPGVVPTAGAER